jgi:hypothetical protein
MLKMTYLDEILARTGKIVVSCEEGQSKVKGTLRRHMTRCINAKPLFNFEIWYGVGDVGVTKSYPIVNGRDANLVYELMEKEMFKKLQDLEIINEYQ